MTSHRLPPPQRQALLGQQPRLLVATPGRLLSQCGVVPASSAARANAAEARHDADGSGGQRSAEFLPGRGSIAARRRLAARLAAEGKLAAPAAPAAAPAEGLEGGAVPGAVSIDLSQVPLIATDCH